MRAAGRSRDAAAHSRRRHEGFLRQHAARARCSTRAAVCGIVAYEPTELVDHCACGDAAWLSSRHELASHGQMLAFEPPHFGARATVGGCIAAGLAGPRRASPARPTAACAISCWARGCSMGAVEVLSFGGTVMKNVAGYDVSRVACRIARHSRRHRRSVAEGSCRRRPHEATLRFEMSEAAAWTQLNTWAGQPLPMSASAWHEGVSERAAVGQPRRHVRRSARPPRRRDDGASTLQTRFWAPGPRADASFFAGAAPLWRVSCALDDASRLRSTGGR